MMDLDDVFTSIGYAYTTHQTVSRYRKYLIGAALGVIAALVLRRVLS